MTKKTEQTPVELPDLPPDVASTPPGATKPTLGWLVEALRDGLKELPDSDQQRSALHWVEKVAVCVDALEPKVDA